MRIMALFTTKLNAIDSLSYDEAIDGAFDYEAGSLTEANVLENQPTIANRVDSQSTSNKRNVDEISNWNGMGVE